MRKQICMVIVFFMSAAATTIPAAAYGFDFRGKTDPFARRLIADHVVVGLVIGIVKNGQSQVIAYGEKTKGSGIAPDGDTVYEIGSVSKVFTGVLLAAMVQEGDMNLEDPLQNYLPSSVNVPVADGKPIVLEHLATHTSGLPRMPDNFKPGDALNPYADYTTELMYAFLAGHKLRRPPGQYEYSNYGMGLLGHVLARRAGMTYEQLLLERICKPLRMNDTRIRLNEDQRKRLAPPYDISLKPVKNWDIPTLAGAGAIRSTVHDMIRFIKANLQRDRKPLLRALRFSHVRRHAMDDGPALGLGWHVARDGVTLWHNGGTGGYHAWLAVSPEHETGVVVLANTANMGLTGFGEQVTRIALGREVTPPQPRKIVEVDPALLKSYVGFYAMTPDFGLRVTVENGGLMVQATGQNKFPVFAESKVTFFYKVVKAEITFVANKDGRVNKLVLRQNGREMAAFRKE